MPKILKSADLTTSSLILRLLRFDMLLARISIQTRLRLKTCRSDEEMKISTFNDYGHIIQFISSLPEDGHHHIPWLNAENQHGYKFGW